MSVLAAWRATQARSTARWFAHYPGYPDWGSYPRNAARWRACLGR